MKLAPEVKNIHHISITFFPKLSLAALPTGRQG